MHKFIIGLILFGILGGCVGGCALSFNDEDVTATIKKKESINKSGGHTYLIFTDKGVFQNDDNLLRGKFSSSGFYNELTEGKTYKFTVIGLRVPFLSMYKNIIKYTEVETSSWNNLNVK